MTKKSLAILWDLDGTITDTKACHFDTWKAVLRKHGHDLNPDVYDANFGRNTRTIVPLFLGFQPEEALFEQMMREKADLFRERAPKEVNLIPGVEGWLASAQQLGIPQAIASSSSLKSINVMVSAFKLRGYFSALVSGARMSAKPEPEVFLAAANELGREPGDCLVIEDSVPGVQAAKNAGMACIAVATTWPRSDLSQADAVVDDFTQPLSPLLKTLSLI
ncbi:MAG: HAD family phosphatase [Chloroflexota bacterium]|nr:HAD family phosphatase [Chloroflexota bacterium]